MTPWASAVVVRAKTMMALYENDTPFELKLLDLRNDDESLFPKG